MGEGSSSDRTSVISVVAEAILSLRLPHPVRVAVDGRTACGKTTFADEVAALIELSERSAIRASIDGFHQPAAVRHRPGRLSPDGYLEDARDTEAIRRLLLDPLGPDGTCVYATEAFDLKADQPLNPELRRAATDAVLIVDGTFLQRGELRSAWDFVVFLDVLADIASRRGIDRDADAIGGETVACELYARRYGPAFARYEAECAPVRHADMVVENSNLESPVLVARR